MRGGREERGSTGADEFEKYWKGRYGGGRYGTWIGLVVGVALVAAFTIHTITSSTNGGVAGIAPGVKVPPFAVPRAYGHIQGSADIATHPNEGQRGKVPACRERAPGVLNICELYERGPVVLALFIDAGSCPSVIGEMQRLEPSFPGVKFAAVAIKGERPGVHKLVAEHGYTLPVGYDETGVLAGLYQMATCTQVSFILPGGRVHSNAILSTPTTGQLRARVSSLLHAATAAGWSRG